jgi:hypothetical protein
MKKSISDVKQFIYDKVKHLKINIDDDWLNNNELDMALSSQNNKRKNIFKIALEKKGYKFKDPNIIITGYRMKCDVICPNDHIYITYMDNFINRRRECKYC